jgi:hypothetical protein
LSVGRATLRDVDVSAEGIVNIPPGNLRVRRAEFAGLWVAAERLHDERVRRRMPDWYGAGVVVTCRWLARATVKPETGPGCPAWSPVTKRTDLAHEELIEAEYLEAVRWAMRRPRPAWLENRPGWIEAIEATLHWAWHGYGGPPLEIDQTAVS